MRPTFVEIDLTAVADNIGRFRRLVAPSMVCAVVKADGYGHGDVPVGEAAIAAGADWLAVALVEEGVRLREAGVDSPVLLLSEPGPDSAADVLEWGLTPTVYSVAFVEALAAIGSPVGVHLKVDTGMHRVGVSPGDLPALVASIRAAKTLSLDAVWTHFAVADEDPTFTRTQIDRFLDAIDGLDPPSTHLANTAGAVLFPEARRDMVRVGLGAYGLHPCPQTREVIELRPAMRVVSHVTQVHRHPLGTRPSYGRVRSLREEATVATIPIGYADGYPWGLFDFEVLIGGVRHPLAGRVTMDQIVVDVGDHRVEVDDEVVLLGRQGGEEITAEAWSDALGTISYEVVCGIGPRVPRRYLS